MYSEREALNALAAMILYRAVQDSKMMKYKKELGRFVKTEWFDDLSYIVGIDSACIRNKIQKEIAK